MNDELDKDLKQRIDALPRELEPTRDLWPGIEARLARRTRRSWVPAAVAASVVLSAASAFFTWNLYQAQQEEARALRAQIAAIESPYLPVRASYDREWGVLRTRLDPETAEVIERNVALIRQANQEILQALGENPRDPSLRRLLRQTLATEADVYRQAFSAALRYSAAERPESVHSETPGSARRLLI